MGEVTAISWADSTFNPWRGCEKVSPACARCYAERDTKRYGLELWGADAPRPVTTDAYWRQPLRWDADARTAGVRRRVFCASLADVFEDRRDLDAPRARLFDLIHRTTNLDWLLLTKRPQNVNRLRHAWDLAELPVWLGATAENQRYCEERARDLLCVEARVRFLSMEPLLEPVVLPAWVLDGVDWIIVGGESGAGAREMKVEWVRALRDQCRKAGVGFWMKQWWGVRPEKNPLVDGVLHRELPTPGRRSDGPDVRHIVEHFKRLELD